METAGARNAYCCEKCHGQIVTVNLADGTTPFMIKCRANWPSECDGMAQSQFYNIDQTTPATWGWHRPDAEETQRLESLHPGMAQHVQSGGLVLRKLDNAERELYGGRRVRHG